MDSKEILWNSTSPKDQGFKEGTPLGNDLPSMVIGEDLRRAIIALRSVPTLSCSADSLHDDIVGSAEYVWKAEDFDWPRTSKVTSDRNSEFSPHETQTIDGKQTPLEVTRTDSVNVTRKRIDVAPVKTGKTADESCPSSVKISGQETIEKDNGFGISEIVSKPRSTRSSTRSKSDGLRRPPPPPPKPPPFRSQGSRVEANKTGDKRKQTQESTGGINDIHGIFDIYERSLDILESEDWKKKSENPSPRSNSPETLLEELLDSIPADEFDTLPSSYGKTKASVSKPKRSVGLELQNSGQRLSSIEANDSAVKTETAEMKTFLLTGIQKLDFESEQAKNSAKEQNNNDVWLIEKFDEQKANRHSNRQRNTSQQSTSSTVTSIVSPGLSISSTIEKKKYPQNEEINENELTPEDIFEEIMDSMETSDANKKEICGLMSTDVASRNFQGVFRKQDSKNAHNKTIFGSSRDYSLENDRLSVYYNRTEAGMQLCLREKVKKSRSEDVPKNSSCENKSAKNPLPSRTIHSYSGKPSIFSSSSLFSTDPPPPPSPLSVFSPPGTNMTSKVSQESIYCTVKQKPVPPVRGKVQNASFVTKDSLIYCFRKLPAVSVSKYSPPVPPEIDSLDEDGNVETLRTPSKPVYSVNRTVGTFQSVPFHLAKDLRTDNEGRTLSEDLNDARRRRWVLNQMEKGDSLEEKNLLPRDFAENCCGYQDEVDLDLDAEFSRNLEACTVSDIECSGIDKLMPAELHSSSLITPQIECTRQKMRSPKRLGMSIAKRKLQKAPRVLGSSDDLVTPEASKVVNGGQRRPGQPCSEQKSENDPTWRSSEPTEVQEQVMVSGEVDPRSQDFDTRQQLSRSGEGFVITDGDDVLHPSPVDGLKTDHEIERRHEKTHETRVLSEDVTSQELQLKIVWPKKELPDPNGSPTKTPRPPFRELQLHRTLRICDDDTDELPIISQIHPTCDPGDPGTRIGLHLHDSSFDSGRTNKDVATSTTDIPPHTLVVTRTPEVEVEQKDSHRIERVSGSTVGVHHQQTVRVLRGPQVNGHAVQNIKQVVSGVGSKIIEDFQRSPTKRNIRVSCEATEWRSQSSVRNRQDITVIRNTILDTYRPSASLALSRQH